MFSYALSEFSVGTELLCHLSTSKNTAMALISDLITRTPFVEALIQTPLYNLLNYCC